MNVLDMLDAIGRVVTVLVDAMLPVMGLDVNKPLRIGESGCSNPETAAISP